MTDEDETKEFANESISSNCARGYSAADTEAGGQNPSSKLLEQFEEVVPEEFSKSYSCGCGLLKPEFLQVFAKKKVFTFLLCIFISLHSCVVSGFTSVIISTIEVRYRFSSTAAGFIFVVYDVAVAAGVIFTGHFANHLHKPRLLGINCIVLTLSCLIFASPQFLFGFDIQTDYEAEVMNELCDAETNKTYTEDCSSANDAAYAIFVLSSIVLAIPATFIYTIGYTYIDEIVFPRYVSLHFGAVNVFSVIGPAIGYGIGSVFLSIYVNPWENTDLKVSDPAFVGAWWMPFLIVAFLSSLLSIPFLMFPRWLADSYEVKMARQKELAVKQPEASQANNESASLLTKIKLLPINIWRLMKNPSLLCASFGLAAFYIFFQGFISFGPKLVEVEFHLSASLAGLITGGVGLAGAFVGVSGGAFVIYCLKAAGRKNALVIVTVLLLMIPFMFGFFLHCPSTELAGVIMPYEDGSISGIDSSSCSSNCSCISSVYEPVCGADSITYFSSCRAGCTERLNTKEFANCSCISSSIGARQNFTAVSGTCKTTCILLVPLVLILLSLSMIGFFILIPYQHFIVRVVADDQRAIALGFQSTIWKVFGALPGPPLFGVLFDLTCELWQEECGKRGNCWLYDHSRLSYYIAAYAFPCQAIGAVLFICAFIFFPKKRRKDATT